MNSANANRAFVTDFAIQAGKETSDVEDDRRQLLGDDNKPRQRTTDEIKAAYGHAKALVRSAPVL
jgi:hypothetical protein